MNFICHHVPAYPGSAMFMDMFTDMRVDAIPGSRSCTRAGRSSAPGLALPGLALGLVLVLVLAGCTPGGRGPDLVALAPADTALEATDRSAPSGRSDVPIAADGSASLMTPSAAQSDRDIDASADAGPDAAMASPPRLPAIRAGTAVEALAMAALEESERLSPGRDLVVQRQQERAVIGRQRWPQLAPVAELDQDGNVGVGVGATLTLYDFGRNKALAAEADRAIDLAWLDLWQERIDSVHEALGLLVDAGEALALRDASAASLVDVAELRQFARSRVGAGIADRSEQLLFDVRIAELRNEVKADTAALRLALGQIAVATKTAYTQASVPSLGATQAALMPSSAPDGSGTLTTSGTISGSAPGSGSPELMRARLEYAGAEHRLDLTRARRFPSLQLKGSVLADQRGDVTPTATLSLGTADFAGLSAGPALSAADAALSSARANVERVTRDLRVEARRIALERMRLESRAASLANLETEARHSVALFLEQQDVGGRPLTDGITVYRILLQARRDHVSARAGLLRLRLREAVQNGTLVRRGG